MGKSHDRRMILFVHLPGSISSEVIEITDRDTHVFHIKKAIVEAFKRFKDSDASDLHLLKLDGSSHILLNSSQTMSEAGVHAGTTLVVELAAAQVFAPPTVFGTALGVSRKFTVNGAITPEMAPFHYFLPPTLAKLKQHVVERNFFMLYGTRGAGKTTAALHLLQYTAAKYHLRPLKLDFNSIDVTSPVAFWRSVYRKLRGEAERHNIILPPFDDVAGFVDAFTLKSLGCTRVLLMLDEFDTLEHAADGIKKQFLGAVRTIKQDLGSYGVQCIFAVGPFSVLFMRGESGSPFHVREAVPVHFFTEDEVSELLGQFAVAKGVSLEAGIAADIHELTAGHAGLVCACGRVIESESLLQQDGRISLVAWQDYRVRHIIDAVLQWPTIGNMADSVSKLIRGVRELLEQALLAGDTLLELKAAPADVSNAARFLTAEGWLVAAGAIGTDIYRFASPLVRSLAMRQLARERGRELLLPLPFFAGTGLLDVPAVLSAALPHFRPAIMRVVSSFSSKLSTAPAAVFGLPIGWQVPNEAVYHFELYSVLRQWLCLWRHAELYPEADLTRIAEEGTTKGYADLLIGPSSLSGPKHVLELVASSSASVIRAHYSRTISFMLSHGTDRGACISFTAVASASAVSSVPSAFLEWPTGEQLSSGLVAIHVVHDLEWTVAEIHWESASGSGAALVKLVAKQMLQQPGD